MSPRTGNGTRNLSARVLRVVLGGVGVLLGMSVVIGSLMMRAFIVGHSGSTASAGDTIVFVALGGLVAAASAVAASKPSGGTVGFVACSLLALVVAAALL
jgi:hypothetical protein